MRVFLAGIAALALLGASASADSVTSINFVAGTQSFWGPGGGAADFDEGGRTPGSIGFGFNVDASSGTVKGNYGGSLSFFAPGEFDGTGGALAIGTSFSGGSGFLNTRFGAQMDVFGFAKADLGILGTLDVELSIPPFPIGNFIDAQRNFSLGLGGATSVSGSTNFDIAAFSAPGGLVEFGPTFKVTQSSSFRPTAIGGILEYTHRETGMTLSTYFTVGSTPVIAFPLNGIWDFSVKNLALANVYSTGFDGAVGGYVDIVVLGRSEITTKNFDLFDVSSFGLTFSTVDIPNAFSVNATPEPGSLALMGAAAGAFLVWRRRKRAR